MSTLIKLVRGIKATQRKRLQGYLDGHFSERQWRKGWDEQLENIWEIVPGKDGKIRGQFSSTERSVFSFTYDPKTGKTRFVNIE